MPDTTLYYLLIMAASLFFPLILSFDKKVNFAQYFAPLFKSTSIVAVLFILGDILYTKWGVWGFNETYHLPFKLVGLPIEEISFFFVVPYACVFIFQVLLDYFTLKQPKYLAKLLLIFGVVFTIFAILFYSKLYTAATFGFTALLLFYLSWKQPKYLHYLLLAYIISIIPFFIINGFLTGMFTPEPIVWYNDLENLGVRLVSIPIEDLSYSFNLITMNIIGFEYFKSKTL